MSKGYYRLRTLMAIGAMVVLAACGGNVPSNSSVETGTSAAPSGAESTTTSSEGTTGAQPAATAAPTDASTAGAGATAEATTESTTSAEAGTATPDAGTTGSTTGTTTPEATTTGSTTGSTVGTPLTGPNISFGGVTFDVDSSAMPSVTVQNGAVNMMGMGAGSTSGSTTSSGTLSGTIFTFEGMNMGMAGATSGSTSSATSSMFQPRVVVIPVSQLVSYESSMMATGAGSDNSSTTGTATPEATTASDSSTTGTATPEATTVSSTSGSTTSSTEQGFSENSFLNELSGTLTSQSAFASTAMSNSMVLTRAMSLLGFEGYTPAFQSNGEFLEFKNGRGVRFVTAFQQQGSSPSALDQLYYMFHGLTNDNRYYVMAIMPLQSSLIGMGSASTSSGASSSTGSTDTMTSTTEMTSTDSTTGTTGTTGATGAGSTGAIPFPSGGDASAYQDYLDQVVQGLDQAASGTSDAAFMQSLQQFDTLIKSLNVSESAQ